MHLLGSRGWYFVMVWRGMTGKSFSITFNSVWTQILCHPEVLPRDVHVLPFRTNPEQRQALHLSFPINAWKHLKAATSFWHLPFPFKWQTIHVSKHLPSFLCLLRRIGKKPQNFICNLLKPFAKCCNCFGKRLRLSESFEAWITLFSSPRNMRVVMLWPTKLIYHSYVRG